jgi:hypothetical protein
MRLHLVNADFARKTCLDCVIPGRPKSGVLRAWAAKAAGSSQIVIFRRGFHWSSGTAPNEVWRGSNLLGLDPAATASQSVEVQKCRCNDLCIYKSGVAP